LDVKCPFGPKDKGADRIVVNMVVLIQKVGREFEDSVQVESADIEQIGDWRLAKVDLSDRGTGVDCGQSGTQGGRLLGGRQVGFLQEDSV